MAKYLVIVESPAKEKTIKKFLGKNYEVLASNGHVRDLPKSSLGIDVEGDYEPKYITIRGKGDVLAKLRKEVKKAEKIYLATDPDREGEAISWHLSQSLNLAGKKVYRISFNEITQTAVKAALKNPREIDMDLVDAQQARRIVDRMVGYKISPLLWAKVKRGLSAGRVQSVALRMVCDREAEVEAFIPEEYWSLEASLLPEGEKQPLVAKLTEKSGKKISVSSQEEMDAILKELDGVEYTVCGTRSSERNQKAPLPFTTSTLQQEASKALNFPISKTMRIAQQLYEGVEIKGMGTIGLITYLRTDSTRVSEEAAASAKEFITTHYGSEYEGVPVASKKSTGKIQDAHEAIRPSDINRTPSDLKESLSRDQYRLYQLIWKRFAASQMAGALHESTTVTIEAGEYHFNVSTSRVIFDGFMSIYTEADEEKTKPNKTVRLLEENAKLACVDLNPKQHFTQPPAHYTEASLVKAMEELGIGRPSTYSPTITTIIARRYITKEGKNLYITDMGEAVNKIMVESFPSIVDLSFTANMESLLDGVAEGEVNWKMVVSNFYPDLEDAVEQAEKDLDKIRIEDEVTEEVCDECGRHMVIKYGPHGKFLACPGFPECRFTKPYLEKANIPCPKCGSDLLIRKTKKGRRYFGCIAHPDCDFMSWSKPVVEEK